MSILRNEGEPGGNELIIQSSGGFHKVVERLRDATLEDTPIPNFHPYWMSKITLEQVSLKDLHPCALYVLRSNLARVHRLRSEFMNHSIDPLAMKMNKSLINYTWEDRENCTITPPLVEVSEDDGGIMIITDGLHRVIKAKELGLSSIVVIKVQDIAVPLPALPVGWHEIQVVDEVPPLGQKRRYRFSTMDEIGHWIQENWERFTQGLDLGDSMMRRVLEREQIMETYPEPPYAPWDYPGP